VVPVCARSLFLPLRKRVLKYLRKRVAGPRSRLYLTIDNFPRPAFETLVRKGKRLPIRKGKMGVVIRAIIYNPEQVQQLFKLEELDAHSYRNVVKSQTGNLLVLSPPLVLSQTTRPDQSSTIRVTFNVTLVSPDGSVRRTKDFPKSWEEWGLNKIKETPDFHHNPGSRIRCDALQSVLLAHNVRDSLNPSPEVEQAIEHKLSEAKQERRVFQQCVLDNANKVLELREQTRVAKQQLRKQNREQKHVQNAAKDLESKPPPPLC
jgi:hypothetical protein